MPAEDLERRVSRLEERVESMVNSLNKINQTTHDRIIALEKQFTRLEKTSAKLVKATDKRTSERSIEEVVDRALAAYDKARK
jgi:Holliday junction resolvasome RuvABC endonuclease subunit